MPESASLHRSLSSFLYTPSLPTLSPLIPKTITIKRLLKIAVIVVITFTTAISFLPYDVPFSTRSFLPSRFFNDSLEFLAPKFTEIFSKVHSADPRQRPSQDCEDYAQLVGDFGVPAYTGRTFPPTIASNMPAMLSMPPSTRKHVDHKTDAHVRKDTELPRTYPSHSPRHPSRAIGNYTSLQNRLHVTSRSSTLFGGGPASRPWPYDADDKVRLGFCYLDEITRNEFYPVFVVAVRIWLTALGGTSSEQSGHAVIFGDLHDDEGNPIYCSVEQDGEQFWNPDVPYETISIMKLEGSDEETYGGGGATTGYRMTDPPTPWTNQLKLGPGVAEPEVVHEIAHILGLAHEHQRPDRDIYVYYDCTKLRDLDDAMARALKEDPSITWEDLCDPDDGHYAYLYGFSGISYLRGRVSADDTEQLLSRSSEVYDYDSISHYPSNTAAKIGCTPDNPGACPLMCYVDPENHDAGASFCHKNTVPSQSDASFVKFNYPFSGPWRPNSRVEANEGPRRNFREIGLLNSSIPRQDLKTEGLSTLASEVKSDTVS